MKSLVVKFLLFLIILMSILTLSSCSRNNDNAKIQIWHYDYDEDDIYYRNTMNMMLARLEYYCKSNDIPYEVFKYDVNTLAYDNYILKRNVAIANGNAIILEDARGLISIANNHADYSKIEAYNRLIDAYKDRYCIPLGVGYRTITINNEIIKHYGIEIESNIMTYYDYLKIIQDMKEKGARFTLNDQVLDDVLQYYMNKNNIRIYSEDSEIIKDKEEFRAAIKKTITDVCDDFKLYYPDTSKIDINRFDINTTLDVGVYDEKSKLMLFNDELFYKPIDWSQISNFNSDIVNKSFVLYNYMNYSPCVYIYKNVTNNKIYDVVNFLFEDDFLSSAYKASDFLYSPVINSEKFREVLSVDDNWEHDGYVKIKLNNYNDENYKKMHYSDYEEYSYKLKLINDSYKMLVTDKEKTKDIADIYFHDAASYHKIKAIIKSIIIEGDIIENGYNYDDKEIDNWINKKLDDFMIDFFIHNS